MTVALNVLRSTLTKYCKDLFAYPFHRGRWPRDVCRLRLCEAVCARGVVEAVCIFGLRMFHHVSAKIVHVGSGK